MVEAVRFVEQAPWEQGFAAVFEREVLPQLQAQEAARRRALRLAMALEAALAFAAAIALISIGVAAAGSWYYVLVAVAWLVAAVGVLWLFNRLQREAMNAALMPIVARFLGFSHTRAGTPAIDLARLVKLGLLPAYRSARLEDGVTGRHRDTDFALVEVALERAGGSARRGSHSARTAFRGLLLQLTVPLAFRGRILLQRDYGEIGNELFQTLGGAMGMQRVGFDNPTFEQAFEVYADEPAEAQRLLSPALLESLMALRQAQRRQGMTAAFAEGHFYLALPTKGSFLEIGSLFSDPAAVADRLHHLLFEATTARRIVDALHGDTGGLSP